MMENLIFLNELLDQYNNTYHHSINKKPIKADYSALTQKIETDSKAPQFRIIDKVIITNVRIFLVKVTLKIGQKKYLSLILFWKLILGLIEIKHLNEEKNIRNFL